jgi:23S rRNA (uracil1939-C5)-methyltransferase
VDEKVELTVERVVAGGDGLARLASGQVVFVTGGLPGERVLVNLVEQRTDYVRAEVVEMLEASPRRVFEPCRFRHGGCGGCGWMHVESSYQGELKRSILLDALRRTAGLADPVVELGGALPPSARRTTIRVTREEGIVGFHRGGSSALVGVEECMAAHPRLNELLALDMRGSGEAVLRVGARTGEWAASFTGSMRVLNPPPDLRLGAKSHVNEMVHGHRFRVSSGSFFQPSPEAAELLIDTVRALAPPAELLIDAYSGVGLFAATVDADRVVCIEQSPAAVADARLNVPSARMHRLEVSRWRAEPADVVVADPARPGLGRSAAAALAATNAPTFVLVSCDPASAARDARLLASHGYRHDRAVVLDLFPDTPHLEVVTRFVR